MLVELFKLEELDKMFVNEFKSVESLKNLNFSMIFEAYKPVFESQRFMKIANHPTPELQK